jgi:acetolactate synthase-1/2/3 large subunit
MNAQLQPKTDIPTHPLAGTRLSGADIVVQVVADEGVSVVFGYSGGAILPVYDAVFRYNHDHVRADGSEPLPLIVPANEQGAGFMAQGYARASGKVGVALVTSGPGATNTVTPVRDAMADSIPIVVICGQVPTAAIGTDAFQEAPISSIMASCAKHVFLITDAAKLEATMRTAFEIARSGRPGPVVVDIPKDIQNVQLVFDGSCTLPVSGYRARMATVREAALGKVHCEKFLTHLREAKRPLIYAGGGVVSAGAAHALREFAQAFGIPVTTTLMGLGACDTTTPLSLHMLGMHGTAYANYAVDDCDFLIAVGARFDDRVTGKLDAFAPGARVVHLDIDPAEISKNRHADVPIVGELVEVLPQLTAALAELREKRPTFTHRAWLETVEKWRYEYPFRYRRGGDLKPQYVLERLRDLLADREVVWTTGVGQHQMWAAQWLRVDEPRNFITSAGLGTMGFGFPAALGAKLGRPDATVVCIDGDGCFQMTLQELATAVIYEIPIVVCVINNGWLGMVRQWQELFHNERFSQTHLLSTVPDYKALAEAYGALGFRVDREEDVDAAIMAAADSGRPCVIDFRVDHEEKVYPMVPAGGGSDDIIDQTWVDDDNLWVEDGV